MKKIVLTFVLIFSLLTLTGCGNEYGEIEGKIVDKKYDSGGIITTMTYTGKVFVPNTIIIPESWNIQIEKGSSRRN